MVTEPKSVARYLRGLGEPTTCTRTRARPVQLVGEIDEVRHPLSSRYSRMPGRAQRCSIGTMSSLLQLAPGAIFAGDFCVVSHLSAGGMGAVYVVEQLSTAKQRALKLMHPQLVADATMRKRFEQEARIGARIESEHVVEVQAAGIDATTQIPWLVMELLRGEDLGKTVERRGALPAAEVRAIFEQLCHAIGAAHAAGIIHRDLKPENIFLAQSKRAGAVSSMVKVLDFGIAKLAAEAGSTGTSAMGSPMWMSPEQTERGPVTPAADVWALGLMAFHLLTGIYYWRATDEDSPTITQLLREILLEPLRSASVRAAERGVAALLPEGFDAWFARCVARDPAYRFRDATELLAALETVLSSGPPSAFAATAQAMPPKPQAPPSTPRLTLPERPSLAVMPFANMSGDPAQDYFVNGIVEDIITSLSRIKWLFVAARNSTFAYSGRSLDAKQVGQELGVRYVLEGSLRKAGNRVRITGQLIEATTGMHVWAKRYDRALDHIFEVQDELTLSVVGAIEPSLRQAEIERAKRKRPENLDAYDLYLRALPHVHVYMPEDLDKALVLLSQALDLQPDYPAAHAAVAWCYEGRYLRGGMHEADKVAALKHARAAIEGGADDAATLAGAGFVIGLVSHDYEAAMDAIDRGLALTGESAHALALGSIILAHAGDTTRAIDYAERALRLTPFGREATNPFIGLAMAHCAAGNFTAAVGSANKAVQVNPRFSVPQVMLTAALSSLGRRDEAKAAAERVLELEPSFSVARFVRSHTGRADIWTPIGEALRRAGLPE